MFYTYILYSEKLNKYYVGSTENLAARIKIHNEGKVKFTSRGVPWIIKHIEEYADRTSAMKREYEIKGKKSRKYIEWIISSKN